METNVNRLMFCDARGPLNQINDVLAGKNGKLWLKGINAYLRQGAIKAFGWKTYGPFQLRLFESVEVLMSSIKYKINQKRFFSNEHDIELFIKQIDEYPINEEFEIKFVSMTVSELGFDEGATLSEIENCLPSLELEICKQSDAPRLFLSDDKTLDEIRKIREGIFVSKPFLRNLRGKEDPERPFLFNLFFTGEDKVSLLIHWSENTDKDGKYPLDLFLDSYRKIVLRTKK